MEPTIPDTQHPTPDAELPADALPAVEIAPAFSEQSQAIFAIDSEERACWLLRKLGNLDAEKNRVKAQADALLRQLDSDRESLMHRFGSELEAWTRQELERKGGKRKSVTLLQGTLAFRTVPARLTVADEAAAIVAARSWQSAATRQGYDLLPVTLNRADFVKFAQSEMERTGEMLPGVGTVEGRESFSIKFKGED